MILLLLEVSWLLTKTVCRGSWWLCRTLISSPSLTDAERLQQLEQQVKLLQYQQQLSRERMEAATSALTAPSHGDKGCLCQPD